METLKYGLESHVCSLCVCAAHLEDLFKLHWSQFCAWDILLHV